VGIKMKRTKKLIIAILLVVLIGLLASIYGALNTGPDLSQEDKDILILAADKYEQPNGGVDMAFMIHLENGSFANYTPVYPGGMTHPTQPASSAIGGGKMFLHDSLYDGVEDGMQYAKEIVEYNTNMTVDAVVIVYDEGVDNVINSVRPLEVDGQVTNLSATDIIRENDAYNGYAGNEGVTGTMSRSDAVMVLVKALAQAAADPDKKATMVRTALDEYSKGNIIMQPEGSFTKLLATKGIESIGS
jgi:anionic cell wall polymer biosynthesis LytR-Cps2A-Psr (LCP) family protein